jgi:methyl-accepting chemotaxis protein
MGYSTPNGSSQRRTDQALPALLPSLSLPVSLVRTTLGVTADVAGRTLRACAAVDPAAVITAVAALPAIAEGIAQLVQRLAVTAERVDGVIDGVESTQRHVDGLLDDLEGLPAKVDGIATAADRSIGRVDGVVDSVSKQIGEVEGIVRRVDGVVESTGSVLSRAGTTIDSAGRVIDGADGLVAKGSGVIDDVGGVIGGGQRTIEQANATIRAADPSVRQLAEITDTVSRLRPLLENLQEVDPALSKELVSVLRTLPGLVGRVDERVFPALSALEGLVPVVQTLNENVDQLQSVVNDVGTLLSGLPGAGRLLKRGGREVRSPENKTSITPPE